MDYGLWTVDYEQWIMDYGTIISIIYHPSSIIHHLSTCSLIFVNLTIYGELIYFFEGE
jgi:hypothetical protein